MNEIKAQIDESDSFTEMKVITDNKNLTNQTQKTTYSHLSTNDEEKQETTLSQEVYETAFSSPFPFGFLDTFSITKLVNCYSICQDKFGNPIFLIGPNCIYKNYNIK